MKPIFLVFSGLHSYTEEQEIDFTELLGAGVFGIFGPTGSGKSTILDAMTLALYGSVERAAHRTRGIINQDCDQVSVAYTFELGSAVLTRRYRAERTFRRGKEFESVEAAQARLVELTMGDPGEEEILHVLADKATTVTSEVEGILGLTLSDFTRAVVLPQGKFAEFLTLQGKDRRDMLQRLFGLEVYGDVLLARVRARLGETSGELDSVQAALAELGDASEEVLVAARNRFSEAEQAEQVARVATEETQKRYEELTRVWEWQNELTQVAQAEKELAERVPHIESLRQQLGNAERSERLRVPLQTFEAAQEEYVEAVANAESVSKQAQAAKETLEQAQAARRRAEEAYAKQSPDLFRRQAEIERALEQQQKHSQVKSDLSTVEQEMGRLSAGLEEWEAVRDRAFQEAAQAEARLQRAHEEVSLRTVDPDERRRIGAAVAALSRVEEAHEQLEREEKARQKAVEACEEAKNQATQAAQMTRDLRQQCHDAEDRRSEHRQAQPWPREELDFRRQSLHEDLRVTERVLTLAPQMEQAAETVKELTQQTADIEAMFTEAKKALDQKEVAAQRAREALAAAERELHAAHDADQAATLAVHLQAGQPCPVCGSTEHPYPRIGQTRQVIEALQKTVEECLEACQQADVAVDQAKEIGIRESSKLDSVNARLIRAEQDLQRLQGQMEQEMARLPQVWQSLTALELKREAGQAELSLQDREKALSVWEREEKRLQKVCEELAKGLAEAEKKQASTDARYENAERARAESEARVAEVQARWAFLHAELDVLSDNRSPTEIKEAAERLARWDKQLQALQEQINVYETQAKKAAQQVEGSRQAGEQLRQELTVLQERRQGLLQQSEQIATEIAALVGLEITPKKAQQEVTARLQALSDAQSAALEAERQAQAHWQRVAQAYAGAQERLQGAGARRQDAETALQEALREAGFATPEDAQATLCSQERRTEMRAEIDAYHQQCLKWESERERLEGLLNDRRVCAQERQEWHERLQAANEARDAALQETAVAARAYKELQTRHKRWQELRKKEATLTDLLGRLRDLSSLFAGGAFVDFLAEEQLDCIARDASAHLGQLTRYRYALEVTSDGSFVIRDDAHGGYKRTVGTLSGGETFLASLALALALSSQIQLRGRFPLEFFFLDEGFGSLDQETLDNVMTALERLHVAHLHVGVISHVQELRNRLQRYVVVSPAVPGIRGSEVRVV